MKMKLFSLSSDNELPVAKLQARITGSFNAFSEDAVSFENFQSLKELFPSLSDALRTSELIVLAVEPRIIVKTKLKLLAALSLKTEVNSDILNKLNKRTALSDEEKELISKIPLSSIPLISNDGINSGFVIKKGKQQIVFIPLDEDRIDFILRNGVVPYLTTGEVLKEVNPLEDNAAAYNQAGSDDKIIADDVILRTLNILRESNATVSINSNANSEIIKTSGANIIDFSDLFLFTPSVEDRGNYNITDYTAQMAKSSKELTLSTFGASISDICQTEECRYICISVATDKSAIVRKIYMENDETAGDFIRDAAEELILLIGEKASGIGAVGIEISEDNKPEKTSFISKKSGKIILSAVALVLVALIITSIILLKKQKENEAPATTAPTTAVTTTQPTTAPIAVQVPKVLFSELMYKEAIEGIKEPEPTQGTTQGTTAAPPTTANNADPNALPEKIIVNGEAIDAKEAIARIVATEMDDSYETEAIKAQAVVTYTYIKYRNTNWNITGVQISEKASEKVYNAVKAVFGEYLKSGNDVAFTPYHRLSAGKTTTSKLAFDKPFTYLKTVDVASDKQEENYKIEKAYTADQMKELITKYDSKIKLSEKPEEWLNITKHDGAVSVDIGYVETIKVGDTEISGIKFRRGVTGVENLNSHCFTVKYDAEKKTFTVVSYGSGYGVGMSQKGANKMAKSRSTYKQILTKFYAGTTVA